jgi:hypothetical protein
MFPYTKAVDIIGKIHTRPIGKIIMPILYYIYPLKPRNKA